MHNALFAPLQGLTLDENQKGNVRQFVGDGTPYLKAPGLKKIEAIRLGQMNFPLETTRKFRDNVNKDEMVTTTWPNVSVVHDADGIPVVLRAETSNDGIWQEGMPITITGEWDEESKPKPKRAPKPEGDPNSGNSNGNDDGAGGSSNS